MVTEGFKSHSMKSSAFFTALSFYARVLTGVLAAIGIVSIIALQTGWLTLFSEADGRALQSDSLALNSEVPAVVAKGPKVLMSEMIPVDPTLTYDLSAEVRNIAGVDVKMRAARTYLGVVTFNQNRKEIRGGPGTYRYAGALDFQLYSDAGWRALSGSITGEGDEAHTQFRPGTRYVRIVALLNYVSAGQQAEDIATEIRNVRFAPRLNMNSGK
jgi:hypothetical protein